MADIFLSYASADRERVRALVAALESSGWSVWWDRRIPAGRTYAEVIAEAIRDARCILVVWTARSVDSEWVREEADRGKRRKLLVPVRMDDVEPPLGFGQIEAADLIGWEGDVTAPQFRQLVDDIARILGSPRHATATTEHSRKALSVAPLPGDRTGPDTLEAGSREPRAGTTPAQVGPPGARRRSGLRWTLGAISIVLALSGLGGYWYVLKQQEKQRVELLEREQAREAERARAQRDAEARSKALADERQKRAEAEALRAAEDRRRAEAEVARAQAQEAERARAQRDAEARSKALADERQKRAEAEALRAAEDRRRVEAEAARLSALTPVASIDFGIPVEAQRRYAAEAGWPDRVRCVPYDPASVSARVAGDSGWLVVTANRKIAIADTKADADAVVRIARAHAMQCKIGLDGRSPDNRRWVFDFWERGESPTIPGEQCARYDPSRFGVLNVGPSGWQLTDGTLRFNLNDEADARIALNLARKHSAVCWIGQFNRRPDHDSYLTRYWKR